MAELVLFHHAQGLTPGVHAFADALRAGGHVVHTPDLFEGKTLPTLDEGIAHLKELGFGTVIERGVAAAESLPDEIVYAGFSVGVLPAQQLAQTRAGARGALMFHSSIPPAEFGGDWPAGLPLQIHTMEDDDLGDVDVARELDKTIESAELFLYPGSGHLFTDEGSSDYDEAATKLVKERVLAFLDKV